MPLTGATDGLPTVVLVSKAMTVSATHQKAELLGEHCRLVLVTPERWSSYATEARRAPANFEWVRIPTVFTGQNHLHLYRRLGAILDRCKPALVHIDEEPWSAVTWQTLRHAARVGAKTIGFTWQNVDKRYPPPFGAVERNSYRRLDLIIAGTETAGALLRNRGFRGPIRIVPQFGVDMHAWAPRSSTRDCFGLPPARFLVGYVGRLVPEKGIRTAVEALLRLPGVHLALAGTGPEEGEVRRVAGQLGVADRVHFLGGFPSTRVPDVMATFDALVLPSRTTSRWKEQFGRVLVEAMAMGIPVIGSTSGEIPRVIGEAGLIFPEGDGQGLAAAVQELRDDVLRKSLVTSGYRRVRTHFSQERIAELTLRAWQDVLSGG